MTDKKRKPGRPQVLPIPPVGQSQKQGLPAAETRATFIVREELWHQLKDYQNTSKYKTMKSLMDDMIIKFLKENGVDSNV